MISLEKLQAKLDKFQSKKKNTDYVSIKDHLWKPLKEGKYKLRILPNKFDEEVPIMNLQFHGDWTKYGTLTLNNFGEEDPVLQYRRENYKELSESIEKKLRPKNEFYVYVLDRSESSYTPKIWRLTKSTAEMLTKLFVDEDGDLINYVDSEKGYDVVVDVVVEENKLHMTDKKIPSTYMKVSNISLTSKGASPIAKTRAEIDRILEEEPDIFTFYTKYSFEDLHGFLGKFISNLSDDEDEMDDDGKFEKPKQESVAKSSTPKADIFAELDDALGEESLPF